MDFCMRHDNRLMDCRKESLGAKILMVNGGPLGF